MNLHIFGHYHYRSYGSVKFFFKERNNVIQQGCIKLIKSDSKKTLQHLYNIDEKKYFLNTKSTYRMISEG